jgi:copper chaperone NosL
MAAPSAGGVSRLAAAVVLTVLAAGCGDGGPREIAWGREECAACRMQIADQRFGAQLVTTRGKVMSFDAVECLVGFLDTGAVPAGEVSSLWVVNFARPGRLIDARTARYLRSPMVRSPMGLDAMAFATDDELAAARADHPGDVVTWDRLPALRREVGTPGRPPPPTGAVHP